MSESRPGRNRVELVARVLKTICELEHIPRASHSIFPVVHSLSVNKKQSQRPTRLAESL